jgi:RNA recognition motif-containing protein
MMLQVPPQQKPEYKIFIGNLPILWDEQTIHSEFGKYGAILEIKLMNI